MSGVEEEMSPKKLSDSYTSRGVDVVFHDLVVKWGNKTALKRIDGFVPAGKMVAIMGATGAGKSTLLKALADQVPIDNGRILYDGKEFKEANYMKSRVAIVDQDDVYLPGLPVRETLIQSALFRNPNRAECEELVDKFLKLLKIYEEKDKTVRSVSGGQRKRFCIVRELVTNPELLLCDEATTGLDSSTAKILIETLKEIADEQNTTVICSVQQPSENIFTTFDMIIFLHNGECVYYGAPQGVLAHINYFGRGRIETIDIDDGVPNFLMDVMSTGILEAVCPICMETAKRLVKNETQKAVSYYLNNPDEKAAQNKRHVLRHKDRSLMEEFTNWWRTFFILCKRILSIDFWVVFEMYNIIIWIGLQFITATIFWRPSDDISGVNSRQSSILFMVGVLFWSITFGMIPRYYTYAPVLIKDLQSGNHSLSAYWIARLIGVAWLDMIMPLFTNIIFYLITWPNPDGMTFFYSWLTTVLIIITYLWFPFVVSQFFGIHNAFTFVSIYIMFCFFWNDYLSPGNAIVEALKWAKWLGYYNYAFTIQLYVIWNDKLIFPCSSSDSYFALSVTDQVDQILCPTDAFCLDQTNLLCTDPACTTNGQLNGCQTNGDQLIAQERYIEIPAEEWVYWVGYNVGFGLCFFIIGFIMFWYNHHGYVKGANRNRPVQPTVFLKDVSPVEAYASSPRALSAIKYVEMPVIENSEAPLLKEEHAMVKPDVENFSAIPPNEQHQAFEFTMNRIDASDAPTTSTHSKALTVPMKRDSISSRKLSNTKYCSNIVVKHIDVSSPKVKGSSERRGCAASRPDALSSCCDMKSDGCHEMRGMNVIVDKLNVMYGDQHALKDVSFTLRAGSLVALMGGSGSGKTTTIHAILNKIPEAVSGGRVLYNGYEWKACMRQYVGFVEQDDIIVPQLTLKQSLMYIARFRIVDESTHILKVNQLLVDLQLEDSADTPLGSVSPGERKRFCIARELLGDPILLVLDEPTSSLDSTMSRQLMESLHNLATNYGMTIISSIHQPSQSIFRSFDNVLLLDEGEQYYYGPPANVLSYFAKFDVHRPELDVPLSAAEFMLDVLVLDTLGDAKEKINEDTKTRAVKDCDSLLAITGEGKADDPDGDKMFPDLPTPPWWRACLALTSRMFRLELQDWYGITAGFMFLGLVLVPGLAALDIENRTINEDNVFVRETICNFTFYTWMILPFQVGLTRIFEFETVLRKELSTNSYSLFSYWFARTVLSFWYEAPWPFVWTSIVYWMWNPNQNAGIFFSWFILVPTLLCFFWRCAAMFLSYLITPTIIALTLTAVLAFNFTWNPYFLPNGQLPGAAEWIRYLTGVTFQYNMLMNLIFSDDIEITCLEPNQENTNAPLTACQGVPFNQTVPGSALIDSGDLSVNTSFWISFCVLIVALVVFVIAGYFTLRFRLRALYRNLKSGKMADA